MNTNQKGINTEAQILAQILKLGYSVSIPFGDKNRYDQIWDINNKLLRIQIKTARLNEKDPTHNSIRFNCRSVMNGRAHKYTKDEIDFFATYWNSQIYLIPVEECSLEKVLRFDALQPNQPKICWAKDYELQEVIKRL